MLVLSTLRRSVCPLVLIAGSSLLLSACGGGSSSTAIDAAIDAQAVVDDAAVADGAIADSRVVDGATVDGRLADGATVDAAVADGAVADARIVDAQTPDAFVGTALAAFPGAQGWGAAATGGRGGRVLYVTNLNSSGAGSLQAALDDAGGPRTILFKVSGVIPPVEMTRGNVTIAGHTSPGGVIIRQLAIQGDTVCETEGCPLPSRAPSNFIIRHVRLRPAGAEDDGLRLHRAKVGIIDHVSIGNAEDEAVQIAMSSDISIQNTLIAETLGGHAQYGGMLINYSDPTRNYPNTKLAIHHNMWNRIMGRMPELSRENIASSARSTMEIELSNNVAWDARIAMFVSTNTFWSNPSAPPVFYSANVIGNYFQLRNTVAYGMFMFEGGPLDTNSSFYLSENHINRWPQVSDFQLVYCCNDFGDAVANMSMPYPNPAVRPNWGRASRHNFPAIATQPGNDALVTHMVSNVGAWPRDPMDRRLMAPVASRTFASAASDTNPAGDALSFDWTTAPAAPTDTDSDGMPDTFEQSNGLNAQSAADGNTTTLSMAKLGVAGYTNLEVYLHELHLARMAP